MGCRIHLGDPAKHMSTPSSQIVQKLWSYCNVLRDDGLSYADYVEQLTYLLFLKMADERAVVSGHKGRAIVPKKYDWESFKGKKGALLERHYREALETLG